MKTFAGRSATALTLLAVASCLTVGSRSAIQEMHDQFKVTTDLRAAALTGDVPGVQAAALELARRGAVDGIPAETRPRIFDLRQRAEGLAGATDLHTVTVETAAVAGDCGDCHVASRANVGASFVLGDVPDASSRRRHAVVQSWGFNRLWEGVVGPSEASWAAGVRTLRDRSVVPEGRTELPPALDAAVRAAEQARTHSERTQALGQVLTACADCHVR